jgi:UDP:flavonoid glycosyltransferase YjiC (YdhE family)
MRLLFASTRSAGHLNPLVPFAHACLRAGHEVLVSAPEAARVHVARAGLAFAAHGDCTRAEVEAVRERARGLSLEEQNRITLTELFAGVHARAALPGLIATVRRWQPDVIVRETAEFASLVAAEVFEIPCVHASIFLAAGDAPDWGELDVALWKLGRRGGGCVWREPYLTLAPRSLDGAPHARRFRTPAAPVRPLPDWWNGSEAPLVYVSFGSIAPGIGFYPRLYRDAIDALAGLDARVLVTVGNDADPAALGAVPAHVRVERWVPQSAVMPHAAAMVGHGGSGSTLAALAAGIPLALVPLFADQPYNARRVEELGAGIAIEQDLGGLENAVHALLADPRAAQAIASEIAELPPIEQAVGVLAAKLVGQDHGLDAVA